MRRSLTHDRAMRLTSSLAVLSFLALASCESAPPALDAGADGGPADAGPPPRDWPLMEAPASREVEPGITREVRSVPSIAPPANPSTGDATPAELNRAPFVRFYATGETAPRAIVIAMPGFLGGAGSFESLARSLVRRSIAASEPIEVWAVDRRSNLMEDLRGLDTSEVMADTAPARGYYFGRETIGGQAFAGFRRQDDVAFMSEWGLSTTIADVRALVHLVPEEARRGHVFLMGHSLGGSFAETYAAWRFEDGTRGAEELAGVILVDGSQSETPVEEMVYRMGGGGGLTASPGLDAIRNRTRYFELPFLGIAVYARAEILSIDTLADPDAIIDDPGRDTLLATLMATRAPLIPPMTNAAALGWAFDSASCGLTIAAVSCGQPVGPMEEYDGLLGGRLFRPSDPETTYTWVDAPDSTPAEWTPLELLARSWMEGRTNFAEWYFPQRLPLDLSAVGGLSIPTDGWQADEGLRAFDGALMDAPVLAVAAGLRSVSSYESSRMRGAPVGAGRPRAGATRDTTDGYEIVDATFMTHIDPLSAADVEGNPVPSAVMQFLARNREEGTVAVTLPAAD